MKVGKSQISKPYYLDSSSNIMKLNYDTDKSITNNKHNNTTLNYKKNNNYNSIDTKINQQLVKSNFKLTDETKDYPLNINYLNNGKSNILTSTNNLTNIKPNILTTTNESVEINDLMPSNNTKDYVVKNNIRDKSENKEMIQEKNLGKDLSDYQIFLLKNTSIEKYIIYNIEIPVRDEELSFLNKIVQPETFDNFTDFDGSREYSLTFYQQFDNLSDLLDIIGQDFPLDLLRRTMRFLPLQPNMYDYSKEELLNILLARIIKTFNVEILPTVLINY